MNPTSPFPSWIDTPSLKLALCRSGRYSLNYYEKQEDPNDTSSAVFEDKNRNEVVVSQVYGDLYVQYAHPHDETWEYGKMTPDVARVLLPIVEHTPPDPPSVQAWQVRQNWPRLLNEEL